MCRTARNRSPLSTSFPRDPGPRCRCGSGRRPDREIVTAWPVPPGEPGTAHHRLPHPVAATALARPDHPILLEDAVRIKAAPFALAVAAHAHALAMQGVRPGDTVALHGPVGLATVTAIHAVGWLGAVVLPMPAAATSQEWAAAWAAAEPTWVLSVGGASLPTIAIASPKRLVWQPQLDAQAPRAPARDWPLDEVRLRMVTSGTTGTPKVVALTTAQLLFNAVGTTWRLGHLSHDRWLCCLPLHHVGGLMILMRAAWSGAQVQLMPQFDAVAAAAALDGGTIHLVSLVPTMLERLLDSRDHVPFAQSLRAVVLGGAAASPTLVQRCAELGVPLALSWGMTETASQVATGWPDEPATAGDCGPPLAFAKVSEVNGLLQVAGPVVRSALTTHDRGCVDAKGRVKVHGRSDDVIISGGENIAPEEVEAVLCEHPKVREAAVLAVPSPRWGQRPVALVAMHKITAGAPEPTDLQTWCRARLSAFKVPDTFALCEALPRNAMGKVSRRALGASWCAGAFGGSTDGLLGQQAQALQAGAEGVGDGGRAPALGVDEGVNDTQLGTDGAIVGLDGIVERHRALTDFGDAQVDVEPIAHAGGGAVGGVGVHHRHQPSATGKALFEGTKHGEEHLLEGRVAVLEESRKKNHASPVDIEKANRDPMVKKHG